MTMITIHLYHHFMVFELYVLGLCGYLGGGEVVCGILGDCVAAAETVSPGDLRLGSGSGGRKVGLPSCLG